MKMKFLFYLGHPAHYHLFKNIIKALTKKNHEVQILIKKKDILEELLNNEGWEYSNILPKGRRDNKLSIAFGLFLRALRLFSIAKKFNPNLMIGTSAEITYIGKILKIPSVVVNEDDHDAVPLFSMLAYPLASHILTPSSCKTGRWEYKNTNYNGYHELAYLHTNYFSPKREILKKLQTEGKKFYILRFAKLTAHHDTGATGITTNIAENIIHKLKPHGNIFITSERKLEPQFEEYRIHINPLEIHHALYFAEMVIGDSQTMAAEAAVLGTPSIRFNDFVGKLGYLEELEHKYGLTYGIKTSEPEKLYNKIDEFLNFRNIKDEWKNRQQKMLSEKIDVTAFMVWFLENYSESVIEMKKNPNYQYNFT